VKLTRKRLQEIKAIARSKVFSPEIADQLFSELIQHAEATIAEPADVRYPVLTADQARAQKEVE
jgi:hypothetical protein